MSAARYSLALVWIRTRYRLELARIWIRFAPVLVPARIRRRIWIRRRLIRNWIRSRRELRDKLDALTDPGLLDRIK